MKRKIVIILLFIFLFFCVFGSFFYFASPASENIEEQLFEVKKGEGVLEIATNLEEKGLIKNKYFFLALVFLKGKEKNLKAERYILSPSMSPFEILDILVEGRVPVEKITIIEGWNLKEIANYLEEKNLCQKEEFFLVVNKDFSQEFEFLKDKPKNLNLEGYLFPDTYLVKRTATCEEIIRTFLKNFDKKLTPKLKEEIKRQNKTIFEIVTMASLLEKEVKTKEEKELVAGILWKRLKVGMPLQVDATITYITGKKTIKITYDELKIDSPYNTYKYLGLPLGPISNPGMESILSAIYPKDSDYWYYLTTKDGKAIFSKTLKEHRLAKAKYLK
ncbi:MAG: endolytic transglycosylase MltG [Candidatus Pacebacteria bacterium]|nr:endolytic transglycosylase MltG [Candidatus Paceibacterota bacterium]